MRRGKRAKARVTCEVTPHHFTLIDENVSDYNTNFKMNPPLRTAADIEAIVVALGDGTIDGAIRRTQGRFFKPPDLSRSRDTSR